MVTTCWADTQVTFKDALTEKGQSILEKVIIKSRLNKTELGTKRCGKPDLIYNAAFLEKLRSIGLEPFITFFIIGRPEVTVGPHTDKPTAALNWCTSDHPDHLMKWYNTNPGYVPKSSEFYDLNYDHYDMDDLYQIDEKCIEGDMMTLVNTGMPHHAEASAERICISIRFKVEGESVDFDQLLQILKENNLC